MCFPHNICASRFYLYYFERHLRPQVQENSLVAAEKHKKAKEDREKAELALAETKVWWWWGWW